jgi:predicted ester cyclase
MSLESNKEIVRRLVEAHVRDDVAQAKEILSPRLVWHTGGQTMGRDDYLAGLEMGARAFSDKVIDVVLLIAEGDRVALYQRVRMRHSGDFQGLVASGRTIEFAGAWFYRIADDRIVETWHVDEDVMDKLRGSAVSDPAAMAVALESR